MNTTLNEIRSHSPCVESWEILLRSLNKTKADDDPLPYSRILEICRVSDCLWAIARCRPDGQRVCAEFALSCAESVRHLMMDPRSIVALDVTRKYLDGHATFEQLQASRAAAEIATDESSDAAAYAARAADWAARVAGGPAMDVPADWGAICVATDAACAAAWEAAWAADNAGYAAGAAAYAAARTAQRSKLLGMLEEMA